MAAVSEINTSVDFASAIEGDRLLVYMTVPWSGPERTARVVFNAAAEALSKKHPHLQVRCISVPEEAPWVQAWQNQLGHPDFGGGYARGAGSILWMEAGSLQRAVLNGAQLGAEEVVQRTCELWQ